jgi:RHS repeat-associated protein
LRTIAAVDIDSDTIAGSDANATYTFLGAGTVVKVAYPAVTVSSNPLALTYWTSGGGYAGFDRLGRVIEQKWSAGSAVDHFKYGYDGNSNRLYRTNEVEGTPHALDELYHANGSTGAYDGLDRLRDFRRGALSDADSDGVLDTVIDGYTTKRRQAWSLDAVGNWVAFKQDAGDGSTWDLEQTRDHNKANEIASIDGSWVQPAYDQAGNMTTGPKPDSPATPQVCTYDAWNRLMTVSEGSGTPTLIVTYSYDGQNRRIRKVLAVPNPDVTYDYYYNESWQVLEVRKGGDTDPLEQYVWGLQYVDAPVVRFRDGNLDGDLLDTQDNTDSTLYYTYDAQFNVTALVDTSGTPQERYVYDPYGKVKFLDGSWDEISSAFDNEVLYCGYRFDPESGLYHVRERYYDPITGTWKTRDPILYGDGMNLYEYVSSAPTDYIDPTGQGKWAYLVKLIRKGGKTCRIWGRKIPSELAIRLARKSEKPGRVGDVISMGGSKAAAKEAAESVTGEAILHSRPKVGDPHYHPVLPDGTKGATHFTFSESAKNIVLIFIPGSEVFDAGELLGEYGKEFVEQARSNKAADLRRTSGGAIPILDAWADAINQEALYDSDQKEISKETVKEVEKYMNWSEYDAAQAEKYDRWSDYDFWHDNIDQANYNYHQYEKYLKQSEYNYKQALRLLEIAE